MRVEDTKKSSEAQRLAEAVLAARSRRLRTRRRQRTRVGLESGHHTAELNTVQA